LHTAAYRQLGLDWTYESVEVSGEGLAAYVGLRDTTWRGLSLTMPLKRDVIPLLDSVDELATLTGSANTLLFGADGSRHGFNTDVFGITESFARLGHTAFEHVHVLGGGATAATAVVAAARLGARRVTVSVREPQRASPLTAIGRAAAVPVTIGVLDAAADVSSDALISTLPNGVDAGVDFDEATRRSTVLFDVAYEPWPTPLAASWLEVGGTVVPGIDMLVHQAVMQVRVFLHGSPDVRLPDEAAVLAAMQAVVGRPTA
jgi:shikimate dehydrogenase